MNKIPRSIIVLSQRSITTSSVLSGKKNFRKFPLYNQRGTRQFREAREAGEFPDIPFDKRGEKDVGYIDKKRKFVQVPEMIPELIVPNLEGFTLKPYVSYRAPDVTQTEFTAEDLFNEVYAPKIVNDWNNKKLTGDGQPIEPSAEELLDASDAILAAEKTGSDLFEEDRKYGLENVAKY